MITTFDNKLREIGKLADAEQLPCFLVGGAVRDQLLGKEIKDIDIMVVGDPIMFSKKMYDALGGHGYALFQKFRTARFNVDIESVPLIIEVVGARKESYNHDSRKPITEIGSLEDDLSRRDFTINALAICLNQNKYGEVVDLFNGKGDIEAKLLRTPLDPAETFSDDPLRMMRAARFASQLDFTLDPKSLDAIKFFAERIKIVSQERISDEFLKIVASPKPSVGLTILFETGLMRHVFPQVADLHGIEQIDGRGHKDVFWHTLQVIDNLSLVTDKIWLRMAALLHDIAKPRTKHFKKGRGWTFHGHDAVGAKMAPFIFRQMRFPLDHLPYVQKLVRLHLRPIPLSKEEVTDAAVRRLMVEAGEDVSDLMMLCRADVTSKNPNKVRMVLQNFERVEKKVGEVEQKDVWSKWRPPVDGNEIMEMFGLNQGKVVGMLKTAMENAILDGVIPYDREAAINFLKKKHLVIEAETAK